MKSSSYARALAVIAIGLVCAAPASAQSAGALDPAGSTRNDQPTRSDVERPDATGSVDARARSGRDDGYEPGDEGGRTFRCPDGSIGKSNAGGCLGDRQPRLTR